VQAATIEADDAARACETYGAQLEDGDREGSAALAMLLASRSITTELRALQIRLDYLSHAERRGQ
jgi:hypothetical protein